jgi:HSP90 family molecular chaperone
MMEELAEDEDESKYIMFWNNFGKYLKVGIIEDDRNRKEISPLLRFFSSKSGEEYTSLDAYVEGMPEGQKSIYYVTGDGREAASMSPVVEKLTSRGYDVLFATEPLDEIMFESLREYKDFNVVDASKEGLKLDDEEDEDKKKEKENLEAEYKGVIEYLETLLAGKVQKVTVSNLLTDSPAALVQGAYGMSPTMQRYMRAQTVASGNDMGLDQMNQAVMEINPNHPIVADLERMVKGDKEAKETEEYALLIYDVASMTSGYDVKDMSGFAKRVMNMMNSQAKSDGSVQEAVVEDEAVTPDVVSEDE